jgi:hypothetical protein
MAKQITILTFLCYLSTSFAQTPTMPVEELAPGMSGWGSTVFSGTEIEQFQFEVLDIFQISNRNAV